MKKKILFLIIFFISTIFLLDATKLNLKYVNKNIEINSNNLSLSYSKKFYNFLNNYYYIFLYKIKIYNLILLNVK